MGKEDKKKEHAAGIEPTEEFVKRTKEAKDNLSPVGERKKPKVGGPTVTVGTVRTYTNKEAAREAIANDEKERAEAKSKEEKTK